MASGDISKTGATNWEKKPLAQIGDWQCRYCDWKNHCLPYGVLTEKVEAGFQVLAVRDGLLMFTNNEEQGVANVGEEFGVTPEGAQMLGWGVKMVIKRST